MIVYIHMFTINIIIRVQSLLSKNTIYKYMKKLFRIFMGRKVILFHTFFLNCAMVIYLNNFKILNLIHINIKWCTLYLYL